MGLHERVQSGEEPWEDGDFLKALVMNTSEGLLTIDEESRILFANPAIEEILGYTPEELIGEEKLKIIPERLRETHMSSLQRYVETNERHIDWDGVELPALHKEGHEVIVSVSLREHEYDGERVFTGIFTDISERKQRERLLREQKAELEEFAGVLSHDLRNPLSVAKSCAAIASAEHGEGETLQELDESLDRMGEIIDDMLARARHADEELELEPVQLESVLQEAWGTVLTDDATLEMPDEDWTLDAHRSRLKQMAENLFRNAVEHAGEDVTVHVAVHDDGDRISVTDDGPGFDEPITGGETELGESGIGSDRGYGLYVVRKVAAEHGWESYVVADDRGARFEFRGVGLRRE